MKNFVILILFSLQIEICVATCGKETKQFMECWINIRNKLNTNGKPETSFAKFGDQISKCFTDNGCKGDKVEVVSELDSIATNKKEEEISKECVNKLRSNIKKRAEKCIQDELDSDFVLPLYIKTGAATPNFVSFPLAHEVYQLVYNDTLCPTTVNRTSLLNCINSVFDGVFLRRSCQNPFTIAVNFDNTMAQFCEGGCFSKLTSKCDSTLNTTYPAVCRCLFNQQVSPEITTHQDELQKCSGNKINDTNFVPNTVLSFVEYYCQEPPKDPCKESYANDETHKYKPVKLPL